VYQEVRIPRKGNGNMCRFEKPVEGLSTMSLMILVQWFRTSRVVRGNLNSGVVHILDQHIDELLRKGITEDELGDVAEAATVVGLRIGHQGQGNDRGG
jgi:hypothetical protein